LRNKIENVFGADGDEVLMTLSLNLGLKLGLKLRHLIFDEQVGDGFYRSGGENMECKFMWV
jgi:hypothetical protein